MTFKARLAAARRDDEGAALVFALIFITVVSVAIAALLSYADANVRATVALHNQANAVATAEGAAQIAIESMRRSAYTSGPNCLNGGSSMNVNYADNAGATHSAVVTCSPDAGTSYNAMVTRSPWALLSLKVDNTDGINVKSNGFGRLNINGDVGTQTFITGAVTVAGNVISTGGSIPDCSDPVKIVATPPGTKNCTATSIPNMPNYAPPPLDPTTPTISSQPTCQSPTVTFNPGIYSDVSVLNGGMSCNKAKVYYFKPGIYYFTYTGIWTINQPMVAGAPTAPTATPPTGGGHCPDPNTSPPPDPATNGVIFVFGGKAQVYFDRGSQAEICGKYDDTTPPIAIYGLQTSQTNGGLTIPGPDACITSGTTCPLFNTNKDTKTKPVGFYIYGTTYVPKAYINLDLHGDSDQYFVGGLILRKFDTFAPASAGLPAPISSQTTTLAVGESRSVVYLEVAVCPPGASAPCAGTVRLKAKVGILDPTGAIGATRQVRIYTWSVVR